MKKYIILLAVILASNNAYSSCLIDDIGTACDISEFRKPMNTSYGRGSQIQIYSDSPETNLNPKENKLTKQLRNFGQSQSDFSYNSSCQFGVCMDTGAPQLFSQRNK